MKKLFFTILVFGVVVFGIGRAGVVSAAGSCDCSVNASTVGCKIKGTKSFPYGQMVKMSALQAAIDWSNCSGVVKSMAEGILAKYMDNLRTYEQIATESLCQQIGSKQGSDYGVTYSFSCVAKGTDDSAGAETSGGVVGTGTAGGANTAGGSGSSGSSGTGQGVGTQTSESGKIYVSDGYPTAAQLNKLQTINLDSFIGSAIGVMLGLVGSVALVMFSYAGVMWMVSMDGEKKAKASKTLMWSSMGIIMILASYAAVNFIFTMIK
ncbi:MAG TPA: pilin [Candidatus Magasanikbacteria bacterium]|nr:pilin [Candidatus Magasanikbacteria bacterium]